MTKTKKKVQMPGSIKNKLQAAIAMLLVSTILLVSSTYAWFTLSTAPEVTGISTSVGANGNLEIALLTTATYANTEDISSSAGDSSAAANQSLTAANITWGNLIDLSDSAYGLSSISLMPAELNLSSSTSGNAVLNTSLLSTPTYGADGRVASVTGNTVSAIKSTNGFEYNGTQTYGVRAVGTTSNLTTRQIAFNSAQNNVTAKSSTQTATSAVRTAVNSNAQNLLMVALSSNGTSEIELNEAQIASMLAIAKGTQTSLNTVVSFYANAIAAYVSSSAFSTTIGEADATDDQIADIANAIANVTEASKFVGEGGIYTTYVSQLPSNSNVTAALTALDAAQAKVKSSIALFEDYAGGTKPGSDDLRNAIKNIASGISAVDSEGGTINITSDNLAAAATQATAIYITGGAIATIADYTGVYDFANIFTTIELHGGESGDSNTLSTIAQTVGTYTAPEGDAVANITDAYGYVLDFAFRTNASESNLLLQTDAVNRVYSGENTANLATQGSGSTVSFTHTDGLSETQAKDLLEALRVVFYNPESLEVYATAAVTDVSFDNIGTSTGSLKLFKTTTTTTHTYTLGQDKYETSTSDEDGYAFVIVNDGTYTMDNCTNYKEGLSTDEYNKLGAETVDDTQTATTSTPYADGVDQAIVALAQNTVQKISVLVYMDGNSVDNTTVINAATSGQLTLNLQFSSSASLQPMNNTALKQMTAATTTPSTTGTSTENSETVETSVSETNNT